MSQDPKGGDGLTRGRGQEKHSWKGDTMCEACARRTQGMFEAPDAASVAVKSLRSWVSHILQNLVVPGEDLIFHSENVQSLRQVFSAERQDHICVLKRLL